MQKYWVDSFSADWADEFDVFFFDIYTDTEKNNINWLGRKFPNIKLDYGFGTNEWWDAEDGFRFRVQGVEATEEEIKILQKFPIGGESLYQRFWDWITDHLDDDTYKKWEDMYDSILNVPEEVFQTYPFELTEDDYCEEDGDI